MREKAILKINFLFYIFLFISFVTLLTDYFEFFLNISYIYEIIISSFIAIIFFYMIRKKIKPDFNLEKSDIFFLIILGCIFATTIVFPDKMYDSINYHLYNQMFPFKNKVTLDYFPNSFIQSFTYPFADRIFNIFRFVLGYRLGISLNYILLSIMYFDVKKIFKEKLNVKDIFASIFSVFAVISLTILDVLDTYYIDIISMVAIFELFKFIFYDSELSDNLEQNRLNIIYISILSGIIFITKISNVFYILVFAIVYLIKNMKKIKNLKILDYILFFIIFISIIILYVYNTWIQTGNPVFPFYNKYFKSDYYPISNWMDLRFGPKSLFEKLLWPIFTISNSCRCIDICIVEPIFGISYACLITYIFITLLMKIKNKKIDNNLFEFAIIVIILNMVWSIFMLGYLRYALVLIVLNNMILFTLIYKLFYNKKYLTLSIVFITLMYNFGYSYDKYINVNGFWSYNNIFAYGKESYKYNIKKIFYKKSNKVKFPKNSAWGVVNSNSGFMKLLNDEIPMIYLRDIGAKKSLTGMNKALKNVKHLYIISDYLEFESFINSLNETKYKISNVYGVYKPSFVNYNNYLYIFELVENSKINNNMFFETSEYELDINNSLTSTIFYGLDGSMHNIYMDDFEITVTNNDEIISKKKISKNNHDLYQLNLNPKILDKENKIKIFVTDRFGNKVEWVKLLILNIEN